MAAATKFTATLPTGEDVTRSSKTMKYEFCVIGQVDVAAARQRAAHPSETEQDRKNYAHYLRESARPTEGLREWEIAHIQSAKELIAAHPNEDAYLLHRLETRLGHIKRAYGTGDLSPWAVLGWSQSVANANKMHQSNTKWYVNVRTIPVNA